MIGCKAPLFVATALNEKKLQEQITLTQYNRNYVVLMFYPGDFTFVCPTEICAFNDRLPCFEGLNTKLFFISTDSFYCHYAFTIEMEELKKKLIKLCLLSDRNHNISRKYGVLDEETGNCRRATVIIDDHQVVRHFQINDDNVGRSVDEVHRLVEALQMSERGEGAAIACQSGKEAPRVVEKNISAAYSFVKDFE